MTRRAIESAIALAALVLLTPVLVAAAVGIRLSSPGPIVYCGPRVGRDGQEFILYKLRTMHVGAASGGSRITAANDDRVFRFGAWLRRWKIDELPQLVNIIRGEMAIVGPRPEDPEIVRMYYTAEDLETLRILPGLTSPGTLYYWAGEEDTLGTHNTERCYAERVLPVKLAIDGVYVREASVRCDIQIVLRTLLMICARAFGRRSVAPPREMRRIACARTSGARAPAQTGSERHGNVMAQHRT